jgi:rubrerythrin
MLNEALRRETASVRFYETVYDDCNAPEVKNFLGEIVDERRSHILKIIQKLNELHARSQAMDGITNSFS